MPNSTSSNAEGGRRPTVLIHGMNFAPEPIGIGRYTADLANYLIRRGLNVEVITAPPHYPGWKLTSPWKRARYRVEVLDNLKVIRCPLFLHKSGFGLWRLLAPVTFSFAAAPVVIWRIVKVRPIAVICVEPTLLCAPAALFGSMLVGAKTILHVQDLEIDAAFEVGHLSNGILRSFALAFERIVMRQFQSIITISNRMAEKIAQKGVPQKCISVIRNWIDLSKIGYLPDVNEFRELFRISKDDFVVLYSGHMGVKQALHLLIEAAAWCRDDLRIKFILAGDGPLRQVLIDQSRSLPNVHFLPVQPEEKLCSLLNVADLHVITQEKNSADLVLPSKLGGMLASRRSILVTAESESELGVLLKNVAHVVRPGDSVALAAAIRRLSVTREGFPRPYEELLKCFSAVDVLPEFVDLICGEAASRQRVPPGSCLP